MMRRLVSLAPASVKRPLKRLRQRLREDAHRVRVRARTPRLNREPRARPVIVSLTTTGGRLTRRVDVAIATIFEQRTPPDGVVLWLDERLADRPLPRSLRPLLRAGLEVRYCEDIGPHTKLIPSLRAFPQSLIVTADDDILYPPTWLGDLLASYEAAPGAVHCHRAHGMRTTPDGRLARYQDWDLGAPGVVGPDHRLFQTGVGGVLFPPGVLPDEVFDVEAFRRLCPANDDIWFKAMALLAGTPVKKVAPASPRYTEVTGLQSSALYQTNLVRNDEQLRATFEAYDLYRLL